MEITGSGKDLKKLIIGYLEFHGKLEKTDEYLINQLTDWWDVYIEAEKEVRKNGSFQVSKESGHSQKSGAFTVMEGASKIIMSLHDKLGLHPNFKTKMQLLDKKVKVKSNPVDEI